jgi:hypothetical protein
VQESGELDVSGHESGPSGRISEAGANSPK